MVFDYLLVNPHILMTKATATQSSQPYIMGILKNTKYRERGTKHHTTFKNQDEEFIDWLRHQLPRTGTWTDSDGKQHDWNGLKDFPADDPFNEDKYKAVCEEAFKLGFTDYSMGKIIPDVPFDAPMVQKYNTDLAGHKADEFVCYKGTKQIKVYRTTKVFVRVCQEGATWRDDQPIDGWGWVDGLNNALNRFVPLASILDNDGNPPAGYTISASDMPGAVRNVPSSNTDVDDVI